MCLSVVAVGAFVFICDWCWYFCTRLGSGSVPLFPRSVVADLVWGLDWCLCFLVLCLLLVLLCLSFGAPVLFQAALGAVLLWSGCCPWSVCLSIVATGALVVSVVAAGASVLAFDRSWYYSRSFSRKHVGLHFSFLLVHG